MSKQIKIQYRKRSSRRIFLHTHRVILISFSYTAVSALLQSETFITKCYVGKLLFRAMRTCKNYLYLIKGSYNKKKSI